MLKVLVVVAVLTLLVYLVARRVGGRGIPRPAPPKRRTPPRMVAPDDDPEFLRELERRRREKARREQARRDRAAGDAAGGDPASEADAAGDGDQDGEPEDSTDS